MRKWLINTFAVNNLINEGYDLTNHHHALSDAEACAWIAREIL
jgi:hypothetical protein